MSSLDDDDQKTETSAHCNRKVTHETPSAGVVNSSCSIVLEGRISMLICRFAAMIVMRFNDAILIQIRRTRADERYKRLTR
jgi:hypothetical protein